jgi:hypothetical protein
MCSLVTLLVRPGFCKFNMKQYADCISYFDASHSNWLFFHSTDEPTPQMALAGSFQILYYVETEYWH